MNWLLLVILLDLSVFLVAGVFAASVKFYKHIYTKQYRKNFDHTYVSSSNISIFIPCKGGNDHLEDNIRTFVNTPYPKATLFFIVESVHDPAYPVIKNAIKNAQNAHVIVAGLAKSRGQKNHNLLQGIKASEEKDDVYVFLDSYTTITEQQLRDLILPLSDPKVTVSIGFKWNTLSKRRTIGERRVYRLQVRSS